jgi:AcrR family transcriptional regulator
MPKKKPLTPRKDSKQSRSHITVEAILEAATQVLTKLDLDKTSTNKIADRAGVSIGSYYQYFPNKESLVVKLIEREVDSTITKFENLFAKHAEDSLEHLIEILIGDVCDHFLKRKGLARIYIQTAAGLKKTDRVMAARLKISEILTDLIRHKSPERSWSHLQSFVMVNAVMGVLYTYVQSDMSDSPADLKAQLINLSSAYLNT